MSQSSVDPTVEIAAIFDRLQALTGITYQGVPQGTVLPVNGFSKKEAYRDFEPGSVIPSGQGRQAGVGEQSQPHVWAFQVHHYGSTRKIANDLAIESDKSLIGWMPSGNSTPISTFFFTMYDETAKNGETIGFIATRFYETTLGQNPNLGTLSPEEIGGGYGSGGYGV